MHCRGFLALLLGLVALVTSCEQRGSSQPIDYSGPVTDWPEYGGDKGGLKYSPLTQIDVGNVQHLVPAWTYRHGDFAEGKGEYGKTSFQATPIVVGDTLYFCTAFNRVIALDAERGTERWVFDPKLRNKKGEGPYPLTCRGVAYWRDPDAH